MSEIYDIAKKLHRADTLGHESWDLLEEGRKHAYQRMALAVSGNCVMSENQKLREMLSVMTGFYGSSLKYEGIEPTSCNNYVQAKQLLEQTK
tara:strand:- start:824 stop:1099 length:276 start_codon:yes stop_codon:yes gene_type:complete